VKSGAIDRFGVEEWHILTYILKRVILAAVLRLDSTKARVRPRKIVSFRSYVRAPGDLDCGGGTYWVISEPFVFRLFCFLSSRDQTQGLVHTRQVLYH
jgi:hypothetical protein